MDKLLSITQAAEQLGMSAKQVKRSGYADLIAHLFTKGGHWRAYQSAVNRFRQALESQAESNSKLIRKS